jgi:hypothetical protein
LQSAAELQPHVPLGSHAVPLTEVVQFWQTLPAVPQAALDVPAAHVPVVPVVTEQHAPLHGRSALQLVEHAWVAVLHALPLGQSALELQPHVSFGRHTLPAVLVVQSTHVVPFAPHAVVLVPVWHALPAQQPVTQGDPAEHVTLHRCVVTSHVPVRQLAFDVPQPQKPPLPGPEATPVATHVVPFGSPAQVAHTPPLSPQAVGEVPARHVPPVAAEQHPPLQGWLELHPVVQVLVIVSHAIPPGQSVEVVHPHACRPPVAGTHALPVELPTQLVHVAEPVAQLAGVSPKSHTPPLPQHPPLQGWPALQTVVQKPDRVSHALPAGQSPTPPHPQVPPVRQALPFGLVRQSTHAPPETPQLAAAMFWHVLFWSQQKPFPHGSAPPTVHAEVHVPPPHVGTPPPHFTQMPPVSPQSESAVPAAHWFTDSSQHPPLHGVCVVPPHAVSHAPVFVLHDCPALHWAAWTQPPVSPAPVSPPEEEEASPPLEEVESVPVSCATWSAPVSAPLLVLPPWESVVTSLPPSSEVTPEPPLPPQPAPTSGTTEPSTSAASKSGLRMRFIPHLPGAGYLECN